MNSSFSPRFKPVVVIPSYNTGGILVPTVEEALRHADPHPVWVSVDGSTDGSPALLEPLQRAAGERLRVLFQPVNAGKGDAVLAALRVALAEGFTHLLTMDADGQHPGDKIPDFLREGASHPHDLLMGLPQFGPEAPWVRIWGRKLTNGVTALETPFAGLGDTLFGMRLYPAVGMSRAFAQTPFARGFDFDPEIAVRIVWLGHRPRQVPVPVRYISKGQGGVSHFHYLRDNILLTLLHFRLLPEFALFRVWLYAANSLTSAPVRRAKALAKNA